MAFKTNMQKVVSKQLLKQLETKVSGKFLLNEETSIRKVLDCIGNVMIVAEERLGEFLQFAGRVDASAIFSDENGLVNSEKNSFDFNENTNELPSNCLVLEDSEAGIQAAYATKIPVICYGLLTNFKTELFEGSKRLVEIAESIMEIKSVCACGKKATVNGRFIDGKIVFTIAKSDAIARLEQAIEEGIPAPAGGKAGAGGHDPQPARRDCGRRWFWLWQHDGRIDYRRRYCPAKYPRRYGHYRAHACRGNKA